MPELVINVPSYIGESYMDWDTCEWVEGITWSEIEMRLWFAEAIGEKADSILLSIGACDGGNALEGFNIINRLRGLKLPIRSYISGYAASMAVPLALAADQAPEMEYTAQMMLHAASFNGGVFAETSKDLRAQADRLDNTNQLLLDYMVSRTGQTVDTVTQWMTKDTWFTATQAKQFGLASTVKPLTAKITPAAATALIEARRPRLAPAVARATKHALTARQKPLPKLKTPVARRAAITPRPMATTAKKPATKPAKPTTTAAAKAANIAAVKAFAQQMGVTITAEGDAPEAVAEPTVLANGAGTLYTDGALAVDSAVFNDEALTEPTDDATYEAEDGREIVVAGGVVTEINTPSAEGEGDDPAAPAADTEALTAAITAALAPIVTRLDSMEGKVTAFSKAVPAKPTPAGGKPTPQTDPKNSNGKPKPKAEHHAQL
ncbi:ATP-dependent Clp protease proteolytic subunit [Hymenobacter sp. GOD-10R]|uniref:ATP-dependent Clp protease proteolytic subunit n=1 Tax=Hymenobacter sp. GOD-10R TaxID=3093922 RepID=UPI002D76AE7A|nr:ATP-dependent Clp protease proteolytic subunit [Hymenobacter sp. GOD-10R]WRQ26676.1 ATP-dependent Clp protease proteolytic subunit [Hymenobacter sp. GOD-10R]